MRSAGAAARADVRVQRRERRVGKLRPADDRADGCDRRQAARSHRRPRRSRGWFRQEAEVGGRAGEDDRCPGVPRLLRRRVQQVPCNLTTRDGRGEGARRVQHTRRSQEAAGGEQGAREGHQGFGQPVHKSHEARGAQNGQTRRDRGAPGKDHVSPDAHSSRARPDHHV